MAALTEGEQNRLIIEHMEMCEPLAAKYRGRKGIPFEELVSQASLALVEAARRWEGRAKFSTFAFKWINEELKGFIERWQEMEQLDLTNDEDENRVHEWMIWGIFPSEGWTSLPATPSEIDDNFERVAYHGALAAAMLSLSRAERKMIEARYMRDPQVRVEQIARDNKCSYYEATSTLYYAVKKLRETISRIEKNRHLHMGDTRTLPSRVPPQPEKHGNVVPFARG